LFCEAVGKQPNAPTRPYHILCDDNKLLDAQPTRRKKKKEQQQQQQQQALGKQNSSFFLPSFLPSSDGLADRKQRQKHGLGRPQFRTQNITNSVSIFFLFKKIHNHVHN
jgi:hypothetical protein